MLVPILSELRLRLQRSYVPQISCRRSDRTTTMILPLMKLISV
jgi:hypothetical protein